MGSRFYFRPDQAMRQFYPRPVIIQIHNSGKAGKSRHKGIRPTVRGSVMNPRDHPYGGGEGKQSRGTRRSKDKWGNITGGRKTRKKTKWSSKLILQRRKKKK